MDRKLQSETLALILLCAAFPIISFGAMAGNPWVWGIGLATLVALGTHWRTGVPYVVTEHDAYPHAELVERARARPGVRAVVLRFLRALTRLGYAEAAAIVSPSERMRRWAEHHGADRRRLRVVPPGVDPQDHPRLPDPPDEPVVAWVGPPDELPMLRQAFGTLRETVPNARLVRLEGCGHAPHLRDPVRTNLLIQDFLSSAPRPLRRRGQARR